MRFDNLWKTSFPYVMALHQAPAKVGAARCRWRCRGGAPATAYDDAYHFLHRLSPAAAAAEPAQISGGSRDRRRQLPGRHVPRGEGGGAAGAAGRPSRVVERIVTASARRRSAAGADSRHPRSDPRPGRRELRNPPRRRAGGGRGRRRGRHAVCHRSGVGGGAARGVRGAGPGLAVAPRRRGARAGRPARVAATARDPTTSRSSFWSIRSTARAASCTRSGPPGC